MGELAGSVGDAEPDVSDLGRWMLCEHRADRTVKALSMFRRARERGLPLEPQLTDLHRRMLYDDRTLSGNVDSAWPAPRQLPDACERFIGRLEELAALDQNKHSPAVAITGPGGIGKSMLALHWAHSIASEYPDGQIYLDLRGGLNDTPLPPSRILTRILRSLGVPSDELPVDVDDCATLYRSLLKQHRVLVVLDNAADADQVGYLLPGQGEGLVVLTGRRPLGAQWTLDLGVPPMDEAVLMLPPCERPEELARKCARLPLALRLAAGVPVVPLGAAAGPEAALNTVLNASYAELDERRRRLLRVVGTFPTAEAATSDLAAMADYPIAETAKLLGELAAVGLLVGVNAETWRVHDLVRAYARDRAAHHDSQAEDLQRLLDWYVPATSHATAVAFGTFVTGNSDSGHAEQSNLPELRDADEAITWLDTRYPSLLEAIRCGTNLPRPGKTARLAADLFRYFSVHGYVEEWVDATELALDDARRADDNRVGIRLSLNRGYACWDGAKVEQAHRHFQHALNASQDLRDRKSQSSVLSVLTGVNITVGRYLRAYEYASVVLTMSQSLNNPVNEAIASENLGIVDLLRGNTGQAIRLLERALTLYRRNKVWLIEPDAHCELARALFRNDELDTAADHADRAVKKFQKVGDDNGAAWASSRLGLINGERGNPADFIDAHRRALAVMLRSPRNEYKAEALNNAGVTHTAAGHAVWAVEYHHEALVCAQRISCPYERARAFEGLAQAYRGLGEPEPNYARRAHELFTRLGTAEALRGFTALGISRREAVRPSARRQGATPLEARTRIQGAGPLRRGRRPAASRSRNRAEHFARNRRDR